MLIPMKLLAYLVLRVKFNEYTYKKSGECLNIHRSFCRYIFDTMYGCLVETMVSAPAFFDRVGFQQRQNQCRPSWY